MPDPKAKTDLPKPRATLTALGTAMAAGITEHYVAKFFDLAERAVVALEKNAKATERLASTVTTDRLPSGGQSAPYVRIEGIVRGPL